MLKIESQKNTVNANCEEIFSFLSDLNNYKELLPEDKISNWESTSETCAFKVQGYKIAFKKVSETPNSQIKIKHGDDSQFKFDLDVNVNEKSGDENEVYLYCEADVNMFIKGLVKGPLTNLFNYMSHKVHKKFLPSEN